MSTINRLKESTVAPISTSYRIGNTATHDVHTMKKETIAAVRDEIRKGTQQNVTSYRQGAVLDLLVITDIPVGRAEGGTSEQQMVNRFVIAAERLVMMQGIAKNQVWQIIYQFLLKVSTSLHSRPLSTTISSSQHHHPTSRIMLGI